MTEESVDDPVMTEEVRESMEPVLGTDGAVTTSGRSEDRAAIRTKRPRSDLQRAALERARVKAIQVRQENAALRKKERELLVARAAKEKTDRSKRLHEEYEALQQPLASEATDEDDEPQAIAPKPKRKRRIIVTEAEDESDEDIEVVLPKKKTPPADEIKMQRLMEKMFTM
jgi:hypothetical protein